MPDRAVERMPLFYHFARRSSCLLLDLLSRWRVVGLERVPQNGPLLVVSNHQNNADPPILVTVLPRPTHCMAKQEIFDGPLAPLARRYGAFPVRRGQADRQAVKTALELLARGSCVLLFPEGTRSRTGGLIRAQPGAGLIALRSGAMVLPVGIVGTGRIRSLGDVLRRPSIEVRIGEPFRIPPHEGSGRAEAAEQATTRIMERIAALLPPELRGYYGEGRLTTELAEARP